MKKSTFRCFLTLIALVLVHYALFAFKYTDEDCEHKSLKHIRGCIPMVATPNGLPPESTSLPPESTSLPPETTSLPPEPEHSQNEIVFCVLTAKRPNDTYLSVALRSLDKDLKLTDSAQSILTLVVDVSVHDADRTEIQQARAEFPAFVFQPVMNKTWEICTEEERNSESKTPGKPPCSVKQQTRDVAAALNQCSLHASMTGWVILLEDDTELCPMAVGSMLANLALLSKAWRCMSFSNCFSGTAIANSKLASYTRYLMQRVTDSPVDYLIWDAWAEGICDRYSGNLLSHKGFTSSFQYRNSQEFRGAYDAIRFSSRQVECVHAPLQEMSDQIANKEASLSLSPISTYADGIP